MRNRINMINLFYYETKLFTEVKNRDLIYWKNKRQKMASEFLMVKKIALGNGQKWFQHSELKASTKYKVLKASSTFSQ